MSDESPLAHADASDVLWMPLVTVVPYALLGVLTGVTVWLEWSAPGSLIIDLVLCATLALWMLSMFTLRPAARLRRRPMLVFFIGFIALYATLVIRDPWFGFLAITGYNYAFGLLRWPGRIAGVAAVAAVAATAQASGVDKATLFGIVVYAAILAANIGPMCGFAWFDFRSDELNDRRRSELAQLGEANRRLEATLAENASLHRQLMTQAREAGALDERARMAREIHDTLAQGLTGIITQLQAAEQDGQPPSERRRHVTAAVTLARESLAEARRSVHALRPEALESAGLDEALAKVAGLWSQRAGVAVRYATTGTIRPMPPDVEDALLRTAQEALANVAKHARAGRVGVTLSYMEDAIVLDVRDDGRGFDPGAPLADAEAADLGGFGLISMRERIESLAGTFEIESEAGAGTAVSARVPTEPAEVAL